MKSSLTLKIYYLTDSQYRLNTVIYTSFGLNSIKSGINILFLKHIKKRFTYFSIFYENSISSKKIRIIRLCCRVDKGNCIKMNAVIEVRAKSTYITCYRRPNDRKVLKLHHMEFRRNVTFFFRTSNIFNIL